jgi:hypothetical protein
MDFYLECTEFISCLGYLVFLTGFSWFFVVPVGEWWYRSLKYFPVAFFQVLLTMHGHLPTLVDVV